MTLYQNKTDSTSKPQTVSPQEQVQRGTLDMNKTAPVTCASPTSSSVSVSAQPRERSPAAERVEETQNIAEAPTTVQQSRVTSAFRRAADGSLAAEQPQPQLNAIPVSTVDQSQPDSTPCGSDSNSTLGAAFGSVERVIQGAEWKDANATDASVGAEDAEDISLDESRGIDVGVIAAASEFANAPASERISDDSERADSAAEERGKVGFRRRRQGGKHQVNCRDKSSETGRNDAKAATSTSSKKNCSPESVFPNALAKWKLMFLPMKDWEDERKARSTVVSRLLGQLTGALAAISAESSLSTTCMLRLLQARTKDISDYSRSLQQSCILVSRRYKRLPDADTNDFQNISWPFSTGRNTASSAVHASGKGTPTYPQETNFDLSSTSSTLFTFPCKSCSTALVVSPELPSCTRILKDSDQHEIVDPSSSIADCHVSRIRTPYSGSSQGARRVTEAVRRNDAPFRTFSVSTHQTQSGTDSPTSSCKGSKVERDESRNSGLDSSSAAREERKKTLTRRRTARTKFKDSPVCAVARSAAAGVQGGNSGGVNKALDLDFSREDTRGGSRVSRVLCGSEGEARKDRKKLSQRAVGVSLDACSKNRMYTSRSGFKEKKGSWWFGRADSVADTATVTRGTRLFSRLSMRPWVLLLLKMTQRSSLHMEALARSEENCLLQKSLRVLRSDYDRVANAQLNAVRKRALEAGNAHQLCCVAWNAYEQAIEHTAKVAIAARGMSLQLPSLRTQQPASRALSMLGWSPTGSSGGNPTSCTWLCERRYVLAAKKAQEQELEHVRQVLRAVLALEDLERWRYEILRENLTRFFLRIRECLTTTCNAVDFFLFDVMEAPKTLVGGDTNSSMSYNSKLLSPSEQISSEPSTLVHQESRGRSWSQVEKRGKLRQQQQQEQREEQQDERQQQSQEAFRTFWRSAANSGLLGHPSPPPRHVRGSSHGGASLSAAVTGSTSTLISCSPYAAASAPPVYGLKVSPPGRARSASKAVERYYYETEARKQVRNSKTEQLARQVGDTKQLQQSLQHAWSGGFARKAVSRDFSARNISHLLLFSAASSPVLGEPTSTSFAAARGAVSAAHSSLQKRINRRGSFKKVSYKQRLNAVEETLNAQAAGNPTSSTSRSSNRDNNKEAAGRGSSVAIVADEGDREEALMAAALCSAAADDGESKTEGTYTREAKTDVQLLQQPTFSADRASDNVGARSGSEERGTAAEWQDGRLSEAAEIAEEDADSGVEASNSEGRRKAEDEEEEEDGDDFDAEESAEDGETDVNTEETPALQSIPSSTFSPSAAYVDLWWLLRRCELLRETGGKVPGCLCNSSIVKLANHLRYPAIPPSVALLKSEQVQRLSSAAPPFSRSADRWKDGYLLLTWDGLLFMFRDQQAALSGEPSFLWIVFLPGAEVRRIKKEQAEPAVVEVREKKKGFSLRRTSVSFRPLTERACEEWVTTLRSVGKDSAFLSAAAKSGGLLDLSEKQPFRVAHPLLRSAETPPVLHPEVLSGSVLEVAKVSDAKNSSVAALRAPDTLSLPARLTSLSHASPSRQVWYADGRGEDRVASPLSALVSADETSSSAESEIRSSSHTLESGPHQRSGSIEGSLLLLAHRVTKTDESLFSDGLSTECLPVVGTAGTPASSTPIYSLKAGAASAAVAADHNRAAAAAENASAGGIANT